MSVSSIDKQVLSVVKKCVFLSTAEIATRFRVPTKNMLARLNALEKCGHIERHISSSYNKIIWMVPNENKGRAE